MTDKHKLEYFLLRYVPDVVRGEFVNIGLLMSESGSDGGFVGEHFTADWQRARCLFPSIDVEMMEALVLDLQRRWKDGGARTPLLMQMMDSYSNVVQLSEMRRCIATDPAKELKDLASRLVETPKIHLVKSAELSRRTGKRWIHGEMSREFKSAGVWDLLHKDLPVTMYTNAADDFTFDFSYNVANREVKLFHAVSLTEKIKDAELFALRVAKIGPAMARMRNVTPKFTAVVEDGFDESEKSVILALALMKEEQIRVARLQEMAAIAETARVELGA